MPHSRRYFVSENLYAVTFRVSRGLPFVATLYMRLLLGGILAKSQREDRVTLCHDLFMGNHPHFLLVCHDAQKLVDFYAEVQKRITDCVKKLLGVRRLKLWEGRPVVARITDLEKAIDQVVYLYANPTRANLVDSIDEYPGFTSFAIFKEMALCSTVDTGVTTDEYWVPPSLISRIPSTSMPLHRDQDFTASLKRLASGQKLYRHPNAWMKCFGIETPEQVAEVNADILKRLQEREAEYRETRRKLKKGVLGPRALRIQRIDEAHTPAESTRRVYLICGDNEERVRLIAEFQALCELCRRYFELALGGVYMEWPPGFFRPSLRHACSAIEYG